MSQNVLVFVEHSPEGIRPTSRNAIGFGQEAQKIHGGKLLLLLVGKEAQAAAKTLNQVNADCVYFADETHFHQYRAETYTMLLAQVAKQVEAKVIVAAASSLSKDVLPRLAARLNAGMAGDVLKIVGSNRYQRPMWAGNVTATVELTTPIQVVSMRATDFPLPATSQTMAPCEKVVCSDAANLQKTQYLGFKPLTSTRPDVTTATRIVSGGRGVKNAEGFKLVEELAEALGGAAVGASRAVCDAGWVPNDLQIGQTGKVVAPNLYIALGISGAIQHLAGMKNSKVIVAINKDPEAPIFKIADYGLVADIFTAVPEMIRLLKS